MEDPCPPAALMCLAPSPRRITGPALVAVADAYVYVYAHGVCVCVCVCVYADLLC